MNRSESLILLDAMLEGSLDEADRLRIEAELIVDPELRQEYYRRLQLTILLEREATNIDQGSALVGRNVETTSYWRPRLYAALLFTTASILLLLFVSNLDWPNNSIAQNSKTGRVDEPSASGFAILHGQDEAVWRENTFADGDLLPAGELQLEKGLAYIELFSGVQLVLEGSARFTIESPMDLVMHEGLVRARVPEPAHGFTIRTASGQVVDLGTEFSLQVNEQGTDVLVMDGEVELRSLNEDVLQMHAGESSRISNLGELGSTDSVNLEVVGPDEFQKLMQERQTRRHINWQVESERLRADPRCLAYYQFRLAPSEPQKVRNLARRGTATASDGTMVAAKVSTDRWDSGGGAFDFSRIGSRVRIDLPGEHPGITLVCWAKINSLDRRYNSLFLTDGHEDGEPHWQLMDDGRVFFSVKVPRPENEKGFKQPVYYSPKIWDPSLSGRWILLAVTYDVKASEVTHYLNGEPLSRESIPSEFMVERLHVGPASIGNWSEPMYRTDPDFVLRNLNGSIDEFAVFSGALTAAEIARMYRAGVPNEP